MNRIATPASALIMMMALPRCSLVSGPDCIDETRSFSVAGSLRNTAGDSAGRGFLDLFEARNARSKSTSAQEIMYSVTSRSVTRSTVTGIHVHAEGTGALLVDIPIDTLSTSPDALTNTYTRRPYPGGSLPWRDLYELVGSGGAYMDVHVSGAADPILRGNVMQESPVRDWRSFVHAYCS